MLNQGAIQVRQLGIRSKLFVSGARPELFPKAAGGSADSISFDLEDAVPAAQKENAREAVARYLVEQGVGNGKINIVRVNALSSELFGADVQSVTVAGLHVLNLPKVQKAEEVLKVAEALEQCERGAGLTRKTGILATIESAQGIRHAYEIACADERMVGLQIGMVDLGLSCGFASGNQAATDAVRFALRLAASEAGIAVFDGAFVKVSDLQGFEQEAEQARALGLNGKSCIHPSQVPVVNRVFSPQPEEVERAVRLLEAAEIAGARSAFLYEGEMVDLPVLERARGILARAGWKNIAVQADPGKTTERGS